MGTDGAEDPSIAALRMLARKEEGGDGLKGAVSTCARALPRVRPCIRARLWLAQDLA
jgi:hypothetical protein